MIKARWRAATALKVLSPCCARGAVTLLWQTHSVCPHTTASMMSTSQLHLAWESKACLSKTMLWKGMSPLNRANLSSPQRFWLDSRVGSFIQPSPFYMKRVFYIIIVASCSQTSLITFNSITYAHCDSLLELCIYLFILNPQAVVQFSYGSSCWSYWQIRHVKPSLAGLVMDGNLSSLTLMR